MKHLKRYNESTDQGDIRLGELVNDLKDILLDIDDIGFSTYVNVRKIGHGTNTSFIITVTISRLRNVKGFVRSEEEFNSIKEVIGRVENYADIKGLNLDPSFRTWLDLINTTIEEFNSTMNDNRFTIYLPMFPKKVSLVGSLSKAPL